MLLLATAYERSGLIELADKQLGDATRASGFDRHIGLEYASFLERRGSPARAEDVLVGVMQREPQNTQILSALAQLRLSRQNWSGAEEIADDLRRIGAISTADQISGAALIGQRRYVEAIVVLQKAYEARPRTPHLLESLTSAFLKAGRKNEAMALLRTLLAQDPVNADALALSGSIEQDGGETPQAIASFSAAIKAQPNDPVGYQALANLYRREKNYDEAIRILRQGVQQQPEVVQLQMALASALEQKGDYDSAISQYQSILDKHPGDLIASNNLASLLLDYRPETPASVQKAQAIAEVLRNSQVPQFKDTLGWVKYHQGDYSGAVLLCEEAAAALPDQPAVRYHLGMAYAALGRSDKASDQLHKALELDPRGPLIEQIRSAVDKLPAQSPQHGKPS
jgi:tetratricopeptide (TPR) repeat protein